MAANLEETPAGKEQPASAGPWAERRGHSVPSRPQQVCGCITELQALDREVGLGGSPRQGSEAKFKRGRSIPSKQETKQEKNREREAKAFIFSLVQILKLLES